MKNQGISLITLIITIIVIIILAAIVIFTGLNTPDQANFAAFCQQVDNVRTQVFNEYTNTRINRSISGDQITDEQIYGLVASSNGATFLTPTNGCYNIQNTKISLPKVNGTTAEWYVTTNGNVFNTKGFVNGDYKYYNAGIRSSKDSTKSLAEIAPYALSGDSVIIP